MMNMSDYTFLDDYDYTLCGICHSSMDRYNNISITSIISSISMSISMEISMENEFSELIINLKNTNSFTRQLLEYHHLHCQKCGLYIEIHPKYDDDENCKKIFICSNHTNPHKYCLCYFCGLLYGINPNQKTIDIINIIQNQINTKTNNNINIDNNNNNNNNNNKIMEEHQDENEEKERIEENEENSMDREVDDDDDHSLDVDDQTEQKQKGSFIDASYMNLSALQTKLNLLSNIDRNRNKRNNNNDDDDDDDNNNNNNTHKTVSCPTSPNIPKSSLPSFKMLSISLCGSPLLGPSCPSPQILGKDVDESEKKWHEYLLKQSKDQKLINQQSTNNKLEKQQKKIEELEKLQKQLSLQKKKYNQQYAKLCRNGTYSKQTVNKLTKI